VPTSPVAVIPLSRNEQAFTEDLPDFLNGAARRRRIGLIVLAVAVLAVLAAFSATIASHFRPI
jgi:hypothetical protein